MRPTIAAHATGEGHIELASLIGRHGSGALLTTIAPRLQYFGVVEKACQEPAGVQPYKVSDKDRSQSHTSEAYITSINWPPDYPLSILRPTAVTNASKPGVGSSAGSSSHHVAPCPSGQGCSRRAAAPTTPVSTPSALGRIGMPRRLSAQIYRGVFSRISWKKRGAVPSPPPTTMTCGSSMLAIWPR